MSEGSVYERVAPSVNIGPLSPTATKRQFYGIWFFSTKDSDLELVFCLIPVAGPAPRRARAASHSTNCCRKLGLGLTQGLTVLT